MDPYLEEDLQDAVAVIAIALRAPGARSPEELWANLRDGVEAMTFFSDDELLESGIDPDLLQNPDYIKASAIVDGEELFDEQFFGMTPEQAKNADPQHRLLLECAWEALESAGYSRAEQADPVGVFVGSGESRYPRQVDDTSTTWGSSREFLASRLSYHLNLRGPSLTVQTACSTSLVAVHLAARSLVDGECDMALAGGASIRYPQKSGYLYIEGGIASSDGHTRSFDARAGGTAGGNGVGVVVLKRLEDAVQDGDQIRAVIRGSAINNDGSDKAGYTAPSVHGQADVISEAQAAAGVDADSITYIEGHGTATPIGDPIEIAALIQAFRSTERQGFCALGSIKSNFGHLDAAAGVAGFIKTVLALEHKMLPPSLHFESPNPEIDLKSSPFYVNSELKPWDSPDSPRRAGVSSFGIGGTNAHMILEEAPAREPSSETDGPHLLTLSARTETALDAATRQLRDHLEKHPDLNLADVAFSLQVGRRSFRHRRTVVCDDIARAVDHLEQRPPQSVATRISPSQEPEVVFLFSGQGSQYVGMGRELYERESDFRQEIDLCRDHLQAVLAHDLRQTLYPTPDSEEEATVRLGQTAWTQPALFAVEYALARFWMARGVQPTLMIGHSIGEYVAACLAGVFSLQDALELVAARGALMQSLPEGSMLAVALDPPQLDERLGPGLSLAAVNGAGRSVISGPTAAIDALASELEGEGVLARRLKTSHAFHSEMVEPILEPFAEHLRAVELKPPEIPVISNLTGEELSAEEATDPRYWCRHLRETVRFGDGARRIATSNRFFLEVGPGRTLTTFLQDVLKDPSGLRVATSLRHPREEIRDVLHLQRTAGKLWLAGVAIDWMPFHAGAHRQRLPLPTYPFETKPFLTGRPGDDSPPAPAPVSVTQTPDDSTNAGVELTAETTPSPNIGKVSQQMSESNIATVMPESELEQIIAQQLDLISQQLELLNRDP